jgi:hypothetical protein
MNSPDPATLELHDMLLRVAGWAPDDVLAEARGHLAEGRLGGVARMLVFAAVRSTLPLEDDDVDTLEVVLNADGADQGIIDDLEPAGSEPPSPWRFGEASPEAADADDLAFVAALASDDLTAAMAEEPSARGLWRAWRTPASGAPYPEACPVYVVESDDPNALPALAGRLRQRLIAVGDRFPQVEVVAVGGDAPVYQRMAMTDGRLLWSATDGADEPKIARVFDAVDPETGPGFAADHERIADDADRERILGYLNAGSPVLISLGALDDVVEPDRGAIVPMGFYTDGTWIWNQAVTYYLEEYQLAPDAELLDHIRKAGAPPAAVDTVTLFRAMDVLTRPAHEPVLSSTNV